MRARHVLRVSHLLNEAIEPHGWWEPALLAADWSIQIRKGNCGMAGGGVTWPNPAESLIIGLPSCSGGQREREKEREAWTRTKKNLYHTQAAHCCLFTELHLRPLYHSIRTAFTPHSREKGPSIKLKTSHWHWRAHRKRPKVLSPLSLLTPSLSLPLLHSPHPSPPVVVPDFVKKKRMERGRRRKKERPFVNTGTCPIFSYPLPFLCSLHF